MGSFLHTGIINDFSFSAPKAKLKGISATEFASKVATLVVDSPDCFACEDDGGFYRWSWKRESRRIHLVPFLRRFYADFYGANSRDFVENCKPVIYFLDTDPADDDLLQWAVDECFSTFCPADDWEREVAVDGLAVQVNLSLFTLTSEGKVMYEEKERHLAFFENALRVTYGDNPFGKCLVVDVSW